MGLSSDEAPGVMTVSAKHKTVTVLLAFDPIGEVICASDRPGKTSAPL